MGRKTAIEATDYHQGVISFRLEIPAQLGWQEDPPLLINGDLEFTKKLCCHGRVAHTSILHFYTPRHHFPPRFSITAPHGRCQDKTAGNLHNYSVNLNLMYLQYFKTHC